MKHRILLMEPTIRPVGVEYLREHGDLIIAPNGKEETLIQYINEYQIEGIVTRAEHINRNVLDHCPTLKAVAQYGVGLDNIDVAACTEHGVKVMNVPDGNFISVAEHAMMSILALSRNLINSHLAVSNGNWSFREVSVPTEIYDKTLLIIGFGRIGRNIAKKAQAFEMKVAAYDPFLSKEQMAEFGVEKVDTIPDGLKIADYVTIQLHLTPETRGMMGAEQFKLMKKSACLINMSRGPVVNQKDLYEALVSGEIRAAALDVYDPEPPQADDPLLKLPNVILTPHVGGNSIEALERISQIDAKTLLEALDGGAPYNWANRKAMEESR